MWKSILKHKNITCIVCGLIIIRFSREIRMFFEMSYGIEEVILDSIFGLSIVLIGLLYKFKPVTEEEEEY